MNQNNSSEIMHADAIVVGAGLAGCAAALEIARAGKKVVMLVKKKMREDSNSYLLAGGIAAVQKEGKDTFKEHVNDTLAAGKFINDRKIVDSCIKNFYPEAIKWLIDNGVIFDMKNGEYALHKEGGHSHERIFYYKDITGRAIMERLIDLVLLEKNISVYEDHIVIELITKKKIDKKYSGEDYCVGVYAHDESSGMVKNFSSSAVFLATGSLGKIFLYTSNSDVATGDGFALVYRLGLPLANMEFIQFHPTVFYDVSLTNETERRFLLTEALRGSGAILKNSKDSKEDFVLKYHPDGSKSTRDVTTRAEDSEIREKGLSHVWLDCTSIGKEKLINEFKNSYDFCMKKGYDISKESVPVVYATHYSNGGVLVDENSQTKIKGLYVIGETSYTGLHGATRLASNSGSECILFGRISAKHFIDNANGKIEAIPSWDYGNSQEIKDQTTIRYYWNIVRSTMTSLCGIARNRERLCTAINVLNNLKKEVNDFYWNYKINRDFLEVRNILDTSLVVLESALFREESRASHFREDFPDEKNEFIGVTILEKDKGVSLKKME